MATATPKVAAAIQFFFIITSLKCARATTEIGHDFPRIEFNNQRHSSLAALALGLSFAEAKSADYASAANAAARADTDRKSAAGITSYSSVPIEDPNFLTACINRRDIRCTKRLKNFELLSLTNSKRELHHPVR